MMFSIKTFDISFVGLREGNHFFKFRTDDRFLNHFEYFDFNSCDINVVTALEKKNNMLNFSFKLKGVLNVNCDITNKPFDMTLSPEWKLTVKFGDSHETDSDESILWLDYTDYKVNVAKYIYETIVLNIPMKRRHPDLEIQEENISFSTSTFSQAKEGNQTNSRWHQLEKLLDNPKN